MNETLETNTVFPLINALLNGGATLCLLLGFYFVKTRRLEAHKATMITAALFSSAFLASYLWYHANYTANKFGGEGIVRGIYFVILVSHVILAIFILPFILRLLWFASQRSFDRHARLARWVWPLWMYTSVTGVLIYMMLYRWFPAPPLGIAT